MNAQVLIDSIVRQATVLIAQLATAVRREGSSGAPREPGLHTARARAACPGVSRKVSADMFGLALRTYVRKLNRIDQAQVRLALHLVANRPRFWSRVRNWYPGSESWIGSGTKMNRNWPASCTICCKADWSSRLAAESRPYTAPRLRMSSVAWLTWGRTRASTNSSGSRFTARAPSRKPPGHEALGHG